MNVGDLMSAEPLYVTPETDVVAAAVTMADNAVGALPVCESGRLVGIITDRDIVLRYLARGGVHHGRLVGHYMTPDPVTVGPEESLERAEAVMAHHRVHHVPVCEEGRLVGMITRGDLARRAPRRRVGERGEAIGGGGRAEPAAAPRRSLSSR